MQIAMARSAFNVALLAATVVGTNAIAREAAQGPLDTSCYYPKQEETGPMLLPINSGGPEHCWRTDEAARVVYDPLPGFFFMMKARCEGEQQCAAFCYDSSPGAMDGGIHPTVSMNVPGPSSGQWPVQCGPLLPGETLHRNYNPGVAYKCWTKELVEPAARADGGRSYRGLVSSTESGRTCQKWTATEPHSETTRLTFTPDEEVDGEMTWGTGLGNHNYCRNPDGSMDKPWCFTMDPEVPVEACEIEECPTVDRNFPQEAEALATEIESRDCECAEQLYGSSLTTKETAVPLVLAQKKRTLLRRGKKGCPCPKR